MNKHKFSIQQGDTLAFALDTGIDVQAYTGTMPVYDRNGTLLDTIGLTFRMDNFIDGTADTSAWPVGKYEYYLRVTSPGGVITDFLQGDICVG
jgi:hypothetical protein